jgi:hypothetical protein
MIDSVAAARLRNGRLTETPARRRLRALINLLFGYDGRLSDCIMDWLAAAWAITGFFAADRRGRHCRTGDIGTLCRFRFHRRQSCLDALGG